MKKNIAVVFPGQGSQSVGMMKDLYAKFVSVRESYQEANDALGFDLWAMTQDGPAETLNQTVNTQPAILVASVACWRVLTEQAPAFAPLYLAGHSLGEYTALVASGQLSFVDAVKLARARAEAMQAAVKVGEGAMAAILGLSWSAVDAICARVREDAALKVWAANDNAPGQAVIAGNQAGVAAAIEAAKAEKAKRALPLPVSVPSHCPLMQPAADAMQAKFSALTFAPAKYPVIHNVDVQPHSDKAALIQALTAQLIAPVRFVETVQFFAKNGVETVIEVGPGKVLSGLVKRIDSNLNAFSLYDEASLEEVLKFLNN